MCGPQHVCTYGTLATLYIPSIVQQLLSQYISTYSALMQMAVARLFFKIFIFHFSLP